MVSRAGRVLLVTWLLLSVMLASVYSSQLTSSLTVGQQALPFTSLAQLLGQDVYTWGVAGGTSQHSMLRVSCPHSLVEIYRPFPFQGVDTSSPHFLYCYACGVQPAKR